MYLAMLDNALNRNLGLFLSKSFCLAIINMIVLIASLNMKTALCFTEIEKIYILISLDKVCVKIRIFVKCH